MWGSSPTLEYMYTCTLYVNVAVMFNNTLVALHGMPLLIHRPREEDVVARSLPSDVAKPAATVKLPGDAASAPVKSTVRASRFKSRSRSHSPQPEVKPQRIESISPPRKRRRRSSSHSPPSFRRRKRCVIYRIFRIEAGGISSQL